MLCTPMSNLYFVAQIFKISTKNEFAITRFVNFTFYWTDRCEGARAMLAVETDLFSHQALIRFTWYLSVFPTITDMKL